MEPSVFQGNGTTGNETGEAQRGSFEKVGQWRNSFLVLAKGYTASFDV